LSIREAAKQLGVGQRTLYRFLAGTQVIPQPVALLIWLMDVLISFRTLLANGGVVSSRSSQRLMLWRESRSTLILSL
jgi:hypothetical protein